MDDNQYEVKYIINADNIIITLKHKPSNAIYESTFRLGDFKGADAMGGMKNVAKIVGSACAYINKENRHNRFGFCCDDDDADDGISCTIYDYTRDEGYLRMVIIVDAIVSFTWDLKVLAKEYNHLEAKIEELMKKIEMLEDRVTEMEGTERYYDDVLIGGCPVISSGLRKVVYADEAIEDMEAYIVKDVGAIVRAYNRCRAANYYLQDLTIINSRATELPLNFLKRFSNLQSLSLRWPKLRSIKGLEQLASLREISLEGCLLLKDVDELASLPDLSYLNVKGTAVTSTRVFADPCLTLMKDEGVSIDAVKRSLGI